MSALYTSEDRNREIRNIIFIIVGVCLLALCVIFIIINPVSAALTLNSSVNVTGVTDTTITWQVKYLGSVRPYGAKLDGVTIPDFETNFPTNYTAVELAANTTHEFCVYRDIANCEKGTTTDTKNSSEKLADFFWLYIYLIISAACTIAACIAKIPYLALGGLIVGIIGYSMTANISFELGFLYAIAMIGSVMVIFDIMD